MSRVGKSITTTGPSPPLPTGALRLAFDTFGDILACQFRYNETRPTASRLRARPLTTKAKMSNSDEVINLLKRANYAAENFGAPRLSGAASNPKDAAEALKKITEAIRLLADDIARIDDLVKTHPNP